MRVFVTEFEQRSICGRLRQLRPTTTSADEVTDNISNYQLQVSVTISVTLSKRLSSTRPRAAYTLVEVLIVLSIIVLLAAVALPTVKNLLANQQIAKTARNISSFIDKARSRAISEGKFVGIRLERLNPLDPIGRAQSIRIRELTSVPPYTGVASNSEAILTTNTSLSNANLSYVTIAELTI